MSCRLLWDSRASNGLLAGGLIWGCCAARQFTRSASRNASRPFDANDRWSLNAKRPMEAGGGDAPKSAPACSHGRWTGECHRPVSRLEADVVLVQPHPHSDRLAALRRVD